ncbi:MAG: S8 family serine peptidase, partial [Candidatus Marinimicrobia bacterium]|nr:S8 family serine peptidase [Candidatus Neomarinimicrobiota bacterium]
MKKLNNPLGWISGVSVLFSLVVGLAFNPLSAQGRNLKQEILVYILTDSLEFPANENAAVPIDRINIRSQTLKQTMGGIQLNVIAKAFPNWADSDTIRVREDGVRVKLPQVSRIFLFRFLNESDVDTAVARLSRESSVLFAERHSDMELHDHYYPIQWHLNNTGQTGGTADADIDAPEAWSIFTGSSTVKLGVIDTGVETNHNDLDGKATGDLPESFPYYDYAHGTHVAGIAAAKHDAGHVRGVDANVQVHSGKVFSGYHWDNNQGRYVPSWGGDNNAYNKIVYAVDNGADVLNNSWGGSQYSTTIRLAFVHAYKMNRVSVVSMGNDNTSDPRYPAAFGQGIIAVGSTTDNDNRSSFSNTGNHIDVAAPGTNILSTWRGQGYNTISGTSMAAPNVSGIATLLKGYNTNLDNDDIEQIIRISADEVAGMAGQDWTTEYGTGRVNARAALSLINLPNVVYHWTASGGSVVSNSILYPLTFYGVNGILDGTYTVVRHEIRKTITFPQSFSSTPFVWGRGVDQYVNPGFSIENPNYGMGWCGLVPGSVTTTSATLRTFVYAVYNAYGKFSTWLPTIPSQVEFAYTALGVPSTTTPNAPTNFVVTNPNDVGNAPILSWQASTGATSYNIYRRVFWDPNWFLLGSSSSTTYIDGTLEIRSPNDWEAEDFYYHVTALNNNGESNPSNSYSVWGYSFFKMQNETTDINNPIPKAFALESNYPNPFNPSTLIRYSLPVPSSVTLVIYDLRGNEVTR